MSFGVFLCPQSRLLLLSIGVACGSFATLSAQSPDLIVEVGDVTACSGDQDVLIPIYISNYYDTVAGFTVWLQLDRPDVLLFDTHIDSVIDTTRWFCLEWSGADCIDSIYVTGDTTYWRCDAWSGNTCIDSTMVPGDSLWDFFHPAQWDFINIDTNEILAGTVDTTGTLISGWEYVEARSLSAYGTDIHLIGLADLPGGSVTPGVGPQEGGLLINLVADLINIPDSLSDDTVNILVMTFFPEHFCFSNPQGACIGWPVYDISCDTVLLRCTEWAWEACLNWEVVSEPPFDSMYVQCDTIVIDTGSIIVLDGTLTVYPTLVGDIDGSGSLPMDIADLVYLVEWMFTGGPAPRCPLTADCNGDSLVDIADLVCWVAWMFPLD